ncbi:MAG: hypothetical protein R3A12_10520 [Ignavibacteria bacterium]
MKEKNYDQAKFHTFEERGCTDRHWRRTAEIYEESVTSRLLKKDIDF